MKITSEKEYIEREVLIKQFETLKEKAETLRDVVYLVRIDVGNTITKLFTKLYLIGVKVNEGLSVRLL